MSYFVALGERLDECRAGYARPDAIETVTQDRFPRWNALS